MIQVEALSKYYGEHAAIRDLSFSINQGEVIGFLGLNGAGKSTTLKVLGCVLLPTSGRVRIDGFDVTTDPHEIRKRIGFLPDTPPLYDEMTVGGYLAFVAELRGVDKGAIATRVKEAETKTGLNDMHDELISTLSHGYRQRVGLAQALVHNPKLLILDEPTGGLDPAQIVEMRELIRALKGEHTVLLSSHILTEIRQICDRYLFIHEGELRATGTEEELSRQLESGGAIELDLRGDLNKAIEAIRQLPKVFEVVLINREGDTGMARVKAEGEARPDIVRAVVASGVDLLRIDRGGSRLENIFLKLTNGKGA